jgi:galactose-1-phosphate uridylyltransferase
MNCGTQYLIYDESGDLMRTVSRKEEALAVVGLRSGWSYKRTIVKQVNNFKFEEALF